MTLITDQSKIQGLFKEINYECGVIAGNVSAWSERIFDRFVIKKPNDGKVSVESTKVAGMTDHIIISESHARLPYNEEVHQKTTYFLRNAKFH